MDGPLAQSLGVESVDSSVMQRPPRRQQGRYSLGANQVDTP